MRRNVTLSLIALLAAALPLAAAPPVKEKNGTLPIGKDGRVQLETYKGTVKISTWDRAEVQLRARIEADEHCSDDEEKVADTEVDFETRGSGVRIRSNYDRLRHSWSGGWWGGWFGGACRGNLPLVHYEITVPATAAVAVKDHKSRLEIAGLAGDLRLDTYKGEAKVTGLTGALDLETYKGDVRVESSAAKEIRAETYKGEVTLILPKNADFDLDAELGRRGDLRSDFSLTSTVRRDHDRKMRAVVGRGGPRVDLETYKGTFRLEAR